MLGNPQATFPTIKAEVHRLRHHTLAPFFSTAAIAKIEPNIKSLVGRLADRMATCAKKDTAIPLFYAYRFVALSLCRDLKSYSTRKYCHTDSLNRCMTVDMISEYAFGKQLGLLDRQDWGKSFYSAWRALWELSGIVRQFPMIMDIFEAMPRSVLQKTNPGALEVLDMRDATDAQMKAILDADPEVFSQRPFPTVMVRAIFHRMWQNCTICGVLYEGNLENL